MSDIKQICKKTICSICATLILYALNAWAASLPPDPDNAALLYYQAILLHPKPDKATFFEIEKVNRGKDPNEQITKYLDLKACQDTIKLAQSATGLPRCNWGLLYSQGHGLHNGVILPLRQLCFLLEVHARTLVADGDYKAALKQSLGIRRFAAHIGDDTYIMFSTSQAINIRALTSIQHILGFMPPDADTLTWLQDQLKTVQGTPWRPEKALKMDRDLELQFHLTHPDAFALWKYQLPKANEDESVKKELFTLARELHDKFLESALEIFKRDISYEQKYSALRKLTDPLEDRAGKGEPIAILKGCASSVVPYYNLMVRNAAFFNVTIAAIEIYLIKAKTGQLPKTIPSGLPKDPYSGKEFEYETTKEGFVLRCRVKPMDEREVRQYNLRSKIKN
jgi:hypothetical protein